MAIKFNLKHFRFSYLENKIGRDKTILMENKFQKKSL